jgi:hypothetical protein
MGMDDIERMRANARHISMSSAATPVFIVVLPGTGNASNPVLQMGKPA